MFPANELLHPFEPRSGAAASSGLVDGRRLDRPEVVAVLRRVCGFFGIPEPQVYVSPLPGHAYVSPLPGHTYGHRAVRIAEQSLADLAADEVEALIAHLCGHLMLPGLAGELSADRAAAVYHGSADPITRVIFAESAEEFRDGEGRPAWTDPHGLTVHSGPSSEDLAVRVREIQAWTATAGLARLAFPGRGPADGLASPV